MSKKLIEIFKTTSGEATIRVQFDEITGNLYVNDEKVVTEIIKLSSLEKFIAYLVSLSIIAQGTIAILSFLGCHHM